MKILIDPAPRRKRGAEKGNKHAVKDDAAKATSTLHLRVTADFKQNTETAAKAAGESVTEYVIKAVEDRRKAGESATQP